MNPATSACVATDAGGAAAATAESTVVAAAANSSAAGIAAAAAAAAAAAVVVVVVANSHGQSSGVVAILRVQFFGAAVVAVRGQIDYLRVPAGACAALAQFISAGGNTTFLAGRCWLRGSCKSVDKRGSFVRLCLWLAP